MTTVYVFSKDLKKLKFESVEKAVHIKPLLIVEERITENEPRHYNYRLFDALGAQTNAIKLGGWKLQNLKVHNGGSYPSISFEIIDPVGEINDWPIKSDRGIWAFQKAVSDLNEASQYGNYRTFKVYKENQQLRKTIASLESKIEGLKERLKEDQ